MTIGQVPITLEKISPYFEPTKGMLLLVVGVYIPVFLISEFAWYDKNLFTFLALLLSILMNLYVLFSTMHLVSIKRNVRENMNLAILFIILFLLTLF